MSEATDPFVPAAAARRVPGATYRLQLHAGFTLRDAIAVTPYLHALGITHAYTSSLLEARPGSTHGYDVRDHSRLNPELGTEADLAEWAALLHGRGMGLLLDTVPNHMCVGCDNAWWADVLENGPASPFAGYFDIAWQDHPREQLRGKVLLPILGEPYGKALESGQFRPGFDGGAFYLQFHATRLPIDPRTYGLILGPAVDAARADPGPDAPGVAELQSIVTGARHLPPRDEADPARRAEGGVEATVIKRRLAELVGRHPDVAAHVAAAVEKLAGTPGDPASFADLERLMDAQAYRPCFWRVASDEINYRRFFDINDLGALSTESEDVFRAVHAKLFEWLAGGVADGLRIDHPDGLYDPKQYLDRLQEAAPPALRPLYVVVEKILGRGERLPDDWAADGTTGYEFVVAVTGLFVDPAQEPAVTAVYRRFTGQDDRFDEVAYRKKFLTLQAALSSELHMLARQLDRLAQAERWSRDFTLNGLRHALREVIACFPVYRSYIDGTVRDADRANVLRAVRRARMRSPLLGRQVFDFIRDTLLLRDPPSGPAADEYRAAQVRFAGKFQQVTAPVTAKGLEDTALYVFNRLTSLNEVGGEPGVFGTPPDELHAFLRERADRYAGGLSPLSTHDTKRGEDVRARVSVLAGMPDEWGRRVTRWAELNRPHKVELEDGGQAPDANEEYLLYQTLVGVWPLDPLSADGRAVFADRIRGYMNKVLHEAKVHTSWIHPDAEYDAAVDGFVTRILDPEQSGPFLDDLTAFLGAVARVGLTHSLAQTLIRCAAPGVPDTYQGTEVWDFSLVDPDNRRPVDYAARTGLLHELDARAAGDRRHLARELTAHIEDGRAKLYGVSRALRFRRDHPDLFAGGYEPVPVAGPRSDEVFAFLRTHGENVALVVVPRLIDPSKLGAGWGDTTLRLPAAVAGREWGNVFTGVRVRSEDGRLSVGDVFADFPVALLAGG